MATRMDRVYHKIFNSLDTNIHKSFTAQTNYFENAIKNESSLTEYEKNLLLQGVYISHNIIRFENSVEKQKCNICQNWYRAIQYCEFCIRKYLVNNFGNWTSGNDEIDKLIQKCQQKTMAPCFIIEWIEYDRFVDVKYLAKGGCATIYTAILKDGHYCEWNSERQILERFGMQSIVLKRLNSSNSNNVHWVQEITLSFILGNTLACLAACYGLTKDPSTQDYMLVLNYYDNDLRHFLKDNYHSLTLLQKYKIIIYTTNSLRRIHEQNIIHRDLHSGNILYNSLSETWHISDLGLSGPVDKQLGSIYGNLPYIAPELLCKKNYTTKSDVYSLGIIMWEVITGETPFDDYEHDFKLALDIVEGCRPKIYEYIPHEYATLMKRCWDANPDNRPDAYTINYKLEPLLELLYNEMDKQQEPTFQSNSSKSNFFHSSLTKIKSSQKIKTSKVYTFNISAQPRNATEEEQEAYETKQFDFKISDEIEQLFLNNVDDKVDQEYGLSVPLLHLAHETKQFDFEISEEIEQLFLNNVDDKVYQEYGLSVPLLHLAHETKQFDFEISEEIEHLFLNNVDDKGN
ncbi:hypothetical protein Glove_476g50 [Diversispora epigaea]|uniref:Protein kinase domain-containing protein n=1 Tax=Diversispora epigaea TaxID=1348612 RepID=A0A397GRH7_9GLOM|nr:hypothetical protein Glove_476g50 [Diversispora epigaea]